MRHRLNRIHRELITGLLLVSLVFRALIPVGFMPSGEHALALQICRAGVLTPRDSLDQQAPAHGSSHVEHCPFASAPASGPIANVATLQSVAAKALPSLGIFVALRLSSRIERAHQPRAPPRLA
jgi:hypothetical protein